MGCAAHLARALRLTARLYRTPVQAALSGPVRASDALYERRLLARDGWGRERRKGLRLAFYVRSHWIRMPPLLLARHLWTKARKLAAPIDQRRAAPAPGSARRNGRSARRRQAVCGGRSEKPKRDRDARDAAARAVSVSVIESPTKAARPPPARAIASNSGAGSGLRTGSVSPPTRLAKRPSQPSAVDQPAAQRFELVGADGEA